MGSDKKQLFINAGYRYNFDRGMYLDRKSKKAFSLEFIDDHDEVELKQRIEEAKDAEGWRFYFNVLPSEAGLKELERILG